MPCGKMIDGDTPLERRNGTITARVVLAGDIGGTNSRFALYEIRPGEKHKRGHRAPGFDGFYSKEYKNDDPSFSAFADVMLAFLQDAREHFGSRWPGSSEPGAVRAACLAAAGAV